MRRRRWYRNKRCHRVFKEQKDARRRRQDREVEGREKKGRKHERKKDGKESKDERETKRGE